MDEIHPRERDRHLSSEDDAAGQQPVEEIDQVHVVVRASEGHSSSRAANEYGGQGPVSVTSISGERQAPTTPVNAAVDAAHVDEVGGIEHHVFPAARQ